MNDSYTLVVALDAEGRASGSLYMDDGVSMAVSAYLFALCWLTGYFTTQWWLCTQSFSPIICCCCCVSLIFSSSDRTDVMRLLFIICLFELTCYWHFTTIGTWGGRDVRSPHVDLPGQYFFLCRFRKCNFWGFTSSWQCIRECDSGGPSWKTKRMRALWRTTRWLWDEWTYSMSMG